MLHEFTGHSLFYSYFLDEADKIDENIKDKLRQIIEYHIKENPNEGILSGNLDFESINNAILEISKMHRLELKESLQILYKLDMENPEFLKNPTNL